jgi:hypothetical protein
MIAILVAVAAVASSGNNMTRHHNPGTHLIGYDAMDPDADHFRMAIDLIEDGNVDGAVASFRACARFSPSPESFLNLGMVLLEPELTSMRQAEAGAEAVLAFEKALSLNPRLSFHHEAKDQLTLLRSKVEREADAMAKKEAETKAKLEANAKEAELERKKFLKALFAHLREGGVVAFKRVQILTIERFGASHPTTTAPDFIKALIAHLRMSSSAFSQNQLALIEIFGASHGMGNDGPLAPRHTRAAAADRRSTPYLYFHVHQEAVARRMPRASTHTESNGRISRSSNSSNSSNSHCSHSGRDYGGSSCSSTPTPDQ